MSGLEALAPLLTDPAAYNLTYEQAFEEVAQIILVPQNAMYLGPHIMGLLAAAIQYGILIVLFFLWYRHSAANDRRIIHVIVYWLMLFATVSLGFNMAWNMHLFVYHFGEYSPFIYNNYGMWYYPIDLAIRLPVSGYFAHRAWRLANKSWILLGLIVALLGLSAAGSIGVKIIAPHDYVTASAHVLRLNQIFVYCYYAGVMAADILITTTIAVCLIRSRTGWSQTDKMINRILVLTAESQLPPTMLSIGFVIIYTNDNTSPLQAFFVASSQTYAIIFLAVLVTRMSFASNPSNTYGSSGDNSYKNASTLPQHATVQITTDTYEEKTSYDTRAFKPSVNRDMHPEHTFVNSESGSAHEYYTGSNSSRVGLNSATVA